MIEVRSVVVAVGMLVGAALAATGVVSGGADVADARVIPDGAVAVVDGVAIQRDAYDRALRGVEAERRTPLEDADRRRVLERLVDEELLVQRALELGLAHHDPQARTHLSAAALAMLTVQAEEGAREVSDDELRALYEAEPERWARSERFEVTAYAVSPIDGFDASEAAANARAALEAGTDGDVSGALRVQVPPGLVPRATISQYLAPSVAERLADAQPGDVLGPLQAGARSFVVRLDQRQGGTPRPYQQVRSLVLRDYVTRAGDQAVRAWLDERRAQSDVLLPDALPPPSTP